MKRIKEPDLDGPKPAAEIIAGGETRVLPVADIDPSPLPSQTRRRSRFDELKLDELAGSIVRHGLVSPITVRPKGNRFEIVAGERRFLATIRGGLTEIPSIIRDLDDSAAAEIQLIENGQRVDQHPIDEAYDYRDMQGLLGYAPEEIAARVNKSVSYVMNRLKLCSLVPAVCEAMDRDGLPLTHALEIAKYPVESQSELLDLAFAGSQGWRTFPHFKTSIETRFLLQLRHAPFDLKAANLTKDGVACVNCPKRTMAQAVLFENAESRTDSCMDRKCWDEKVTTHILITRASLAEDPKKKASTAKVPLVSSNYSFFGDSRPVGAVDRREYELTDKKPCESAEKGVWMDGDKKGHVVEICRNKACKVHHPYSTIASTATSVDATEARRIRFEEIFQAKVAYAVRNRVLRAAAKKYGADMPAMFSDSERYSEMVGFESKLLNVLWIGFKNKESYTADRIYEILELDSQSHRETRLDSGFWQTEIVDLPKETRYAMVFLMVEVGKKGEIFNQTWNYRDQAGIREIAKQFGIDYAKIDAEERLALAKPKHKDIFRQFQRDVEAGKAPKTPKVFSAAWKPK